MAGLKAARLDKGLTRGYLDGRFGGIPAAGEAGSRGQKEGQGLLLKLAKTMQRH